MINVGMGQDYGRDLSWARLGRFPVSGARIAWALEQATINQRAECFRRIISGSIGSEDGPAPRDFSCASHEIKVN